MARRARLKAADFPVHVVQRGHAKGPCFLETRDYLHYLDELEIQSRRHDCALHAFALMTNHVHLLVTPADEDGVSRLMKAIAQKHAQFINARYGRLGSLWGDRFHSSIIGTDRYFLAVSRYIELNPVRAGMAPRPEMYPWTSFRINALGARMAWIRAHPTYLALAETREGRCEAYRGMFDEELDEDSLEAIRQAVRKGTRLE